MDEKYGKMLSCIRFVSVMIVFVVIIALMVFVSTNNPLAVIALALLISFCIMSFNSLGKMRNRIKYNFKDENLEDIGGTTFDDINMNADFMVYFIIIIMSVFTIFKCNTIVGG